MNFDMRWFLSLFLLVPVSLAAQQSLSLDEFRTEVLAYSNEMQMARSRQSATRQQSRVARTNLWPDLSLSVDADYMLRNRKDILGSSLKHYNYGAVATVSQTLLGGESKSAYHIARINELIATVGADAEYAQVVHAAETAYWSAAAAVERLAVVRRYEDIVRRLYEVVKVRYEDGYVAKNDLLMVSARLNEARMQLVEAEYHRKSVMLQINNMMGYEHYVDFALADTIATPVVMPTEVALMTALRSRADYERASLEVDLRGNEVEHAKSQYNPTVSLGMQALWATPTVNTNGTGEWDAMVFARISVPIFHWGARKHAVNAARYAVAESRYAQRAVEDAIALELAEALTAIEQNRLQLSISTSNLGSVVENLSLSTFAYTEGKIPILDVLQSQLSWIQAYTAYVDAHYQLKTAVVDYRYAAGEFEP